MDVFDWRAWAHALPVDGPGCRTVNVDGVAGEDTAARDAALTTVGYLVIHPSRVPPPRARAPELRRHVALALDEGWCDEAREWLRLLSLTSPRAHLVLTPGDVSVRQPVLARERAPAWDVGYHTTHDPRLRRAQRMGSLGRRQAHRRWLDAALTSAARRRDERHFVHVLAEIVRATADAPWHQRWRVGREARRAVAWLRQAEARASALAVAASVMALSGSLDVAWAWLAGLVIECDQDGVDVPPVVRGAQADVALWMGRWDDAARWNDEGPEAECALRQERIDWLRGLRDSPCQVPTGGAPIERLLSDVLAGTTGALARADAWGAWGIRRWKLRRNTMSMWGGVAALLEEMNDADDEQMALRRGCRWVRTHTGTARVCVIASESGDVITAEPAEGRPGADDVRAAIRQGGITIGWIVADRRARDAEELAGCVKALASASAVAVRARLDERRRQANGEALADELVGRSPGMIALRAVIARAAPTAFPVLIEGESGVGKELVARAVHRLSARRERTFAALNCAAITDELFEAEVFGHTRGAFTGAVGGRVGLFEEAHQGTLFLDEVAELSPRAQAKLLRVLQDGQVRRVGDNHGRPVDVRIVAATNRPLTTAVSQGQFREDLVFRLAVVRIAVPPLRQRVEDIPLLASGFWARAVRQRETRAWIGPDAMAALCRHPWPGNVRELQNVVAGLVLTAPARGRVTARHVAEVLQADQAGRDLGEALDTARRRHDQRVVTAALARHAGCRAAAARELGVSRQGLNKLIARLEIIPEVATAPALR